MEILNILLSATIAIIMVNIGSSIELNHLKDIFKRPKRLIVGLIIQIIIFPFFAFIIASISNLPVEYKIGLIILASCPGGTLSNFISYLVKADTPLSIGLTTTNSIVILLTIPIYISLAFKFFLGEVISVMPPIFHILRTVLFLVIVPVLIGSYLRYLKPKTIMKSQKTLRIISSVLLGIFFLIKFLGSEQIGGIGITKQMIITILPWAIILNIVGLFLGWSIARIFKISEKSATTIGIEVGLQNTVLALVVTDVILRQPGLGHPALIYALFSFWITLFFGIIMLENNNKVFKRFKKHKTF